MTRKKARKIAYAVNTVMTSMVFGLMFFFKILNADFLFLFSFPTAAVYVINYILIYKDKLNIYLWLCYGWLILYTGATTVCLGEEYGFHFYCFSMIPCVYVVEYMSFKLGQSGVKSFYISMAIAALYLSVMGYLSIYGPIYDTGGRFAVFCQIFNSITVFGYLVVYTNYIIKAVITSEKKLTELAHIDRLTKLFNRHYMIDKLSQLPADDNAGRLALADIDDFKKINDRYGHNAGDLVLRTVSEIMRRECPGCDIARWGGEEFLIFIPAGTPCSDELTERMRKSIEDSRVRFEDEDISVTVTVGESASRGGRTLDEWIQSVDEKLYTGKKNGKNRVVR